MCSRSRIFIDSTDINQPVRFYRQIINNEKDEIVPAHV